MSTRQAATKECTRCGGTRVIVRPVGVKAQAARCECSCPPVDCGGAGYFFDVDEHGYRRAKPCPCTRLDRRARLFNDAGIPARYHDATFPGFQVGPRDVDQKAARATSFRFAMEFEPSQPGLLFFGPCGTGKTHLVTAILRHLLLVRGVPCRFIEFMHLLTDLRATFGDRGRAEDVMAPLVAVPVLAIDELGKGRGSEWELSVLDELISKRYNAAATTLFTTNYLIEPGPGHESLKQRVGERIFSRLMEMCVPVRMTGEDYRRRISQHRPS